MHLKKTKKSTLEVITDKLHLKFSSIFSLMLSIEFHIVKACTARLTEDTQNFFVLHG